MKKFVFFVALALSLVSADPAQKISKPTLTPKPISDAQKAVIQEGIRLHDLKQFDAAIAKYQQVLAENPDATFAIYELALSYYTKGEGEKAIETAVRGSKYKSQELPLFYGIIANVIDDVGKPKEAIKIYRDAESILKGDKELTAHLSSIYYNLGVTYTRQKMYPEAREELKKAVAHNYAYASPHYLLGEVYMGTKYRVPALLAAARLVSLEFNTPRTERSASIIRDVLKPAEKDEKTGSINIFLDMNAPKDEGDFGMYELFLGTLTTVDGEKNKDKSPEEIFAGAVDTLIGLLEEDKKLRSSFVGKNYVPFAAEMKRQGHTKAFAYIVLYKSGNQAAMKWLTENTSSMTAFLNWAKAYQPTAK